MKTDMVKATLSSYIKRIDNIFSSNDISERIKYKLAAEYRTEAMGYCQALLDLCVISENEFEKFKDSTFKLVYERSN